MATGVVGPLLFIGVVLGVKWKRQVTIDKDKTDKNSVVGGESFLRSSTVEGAHSVIAHDKKEEKKQKDLKSSVDEGECEACDNGMQGSVKSYDKQLLLMTDIAVADWPSFIENVFEDVIKALERNNKKSVALKIMVVLRSDAEKAERSERLGNAAAADLLDIVMYPENVLFSVKSSQVPYWSSFILNNSPLDAASYVAGAQDQTIIAPVVIISWEKLILVCLHGNRDKRCGKAGPQVIAELTRLLTEVSKHQTAKTVAQLYLPTSNIYIFHSSTIYTFHSPTISISARNSGE